MMLHVTSILQRLRPWAWPTALAVLALVAAAGGDAVWYALRWERTALAGQPWRLFTGHLLHLDGFHLTLNLAGLAALWALVGDCWRARTWTLAALFIAFVIGVGLVASERLMWYVGLSGLLHGLLATGAVGLWREWRTGASLIAVFLAGKSVFEATHGPLQHDTVVAAHWWGIGAGLVAGIIAVSLSRRSA